MKRYFHTLGRFTWDRDPGASALRRVMVRVLRLLDVLGREVALKGRIPEQASSLVYTTLLALIPLLAVGFAVLKGFDLHERLFPLVAVAFEPLGAAGEQFAQRLMAFVEGVNVGVLGAVGVIFLLYTAISLAQKVEEALNDLWAVRRQRGYVQRLVAYVGIITVGPLLAVGSLALSASVFGSDSFQAILALGPLGSALGLLLGLVPYLLVVLAFTLVYLIIPHTRVRFKAALAGGLVAGIVWEAIGWFFGAVAVGSTRYTAVYSSLAILVVFMIWLYQSWLILLIGARLAFFVQHPESLRRPGSSRISGRLAERLAFRIMARVAQGFLQGQGAPWTTSGLARDMGVPVQAVDEVVSDLRSPGLLLATGGEPPGLLPGRSPGRLTLVELMAVVRAAGGQELVPPGGLPPDPRVEAYLDACEQACTATLGEATTADLAGEPGAPSHPSN